METGNDAVAQLGRRFAMRLDAALDASGYPVLKASRLRALANALALDMSAVTAFASGLQLPDYGQLLALCGLLRQQPGYFLDEQVLDVPPGTIVVKPVDFGEDLVLRLPSEVLSDIEARKGLRYWRTTVPMGFGILAGEYLIAGTQGVVPPERHRLYLHRSEQQVDVVRCVDVQADRAVFHREAANDVPLIVPTALRTRAMHDFSKLVASIRCGGSFHRAWRRPRYAMRQPRQAEAPGPAEKPRPMARSPGRRAGRSSRGDAAVDAGGRGRGERQPVQGCHVVVGGGLER